MTCLALDIGGANLKASDGDRFAVSWPFGLWRSPQTLAAELRALIGLHASATHLAVTMTGELADCFANKTEGVRFILDAVSDAADGRSVAVYLTDGRFVTPQVAAAEPMLAAASNWHALARFAGRYATHGAALLFDVGSTTCDIIPLIDGVPCAAGRNDTERLLAGELVYTGVERSPVCAVVQRVPYRGQQCPVTQELFATMRDVYLVVRALPEDAACCETADGRPATQEAAVRRLARMIAADEQQFALDDAVALAVAAAEAQVDLVAAALRQVVARLPSAPQTIVLSGHGNFLAGAALSRLGDVPQIVSLCDALGPAFSRCATAYALAMLARETT